MTRIIDELLRSKAQCCGCTACENVCPKQAIHLKIDLEGFRYPSISEKNCIQCKKCITVCPLKQKNNNDFPLNIYAVKNKDTDIRMISSSGGVFSLLSQWTEMKNGIIYGVGFDKKLKAIHKRAENKTECEEFRTSKYMQSELGNTFQQVKNDLLSKKTVLFTGTPCQVQGLKNFLKNINTENLITCDIVCHGVPSPKVWQDYIKYVKKANKAKIKFANFRDKSERGWHDSTITLYDRNDNIVISETQNKNLYFLLFFNHLILRPSCHECPYANLHRPGDISIGDFWGIEKHYDYFDDNKGVSLLMCNTKKGVQIWNDINNNSEYIEISKEQCLQPNLIEPAKSANNRSIYWEMYTKKGFVEAARTARLLPSKIPLSSLFVEYTHVAIRKIKKLAKSMFSHNSKE